MDSYNYIDMLAELGVGSAHPGGFSATKEALFRESISEESTVLDAGCGTGVTSKFVSEIFNSKVFGIDMHPDMIEKAKKRVNQLDSDVTFIQGSVESLPFLDLQFDYIVAESVLSFVNCIVALKEFHRTLKHQGVLILNEIVKVDDFPTHLDKKMATLYPINRLYDKWEWVKLLASVGFTSIEFVPISEIEEESSEEGVEFQLSDKVNSKAFELLDQHDEFQKRYGLHFEANFIRCIRE